MKKKIQTIEAVEVLDKGLTNKTSSLIDFTLANYGLIHEADSSKMKTDDPLNIIILGLAIALKGARERYNLTRTMFDEQNLIKIHEIMYCACDDKIRTLFENEIKAIEEYGAEVQFNVEDGNLKDLRDIQGITIEACVNDEMEERSYPFNPEAPKKSIRNAGIAFQNEFCRELVKA